ncbi:MAG: alanine racemase [Spirochaetaceae bacterium]
MNCYDSIKKPTLLIDRGRARENIRRMAEKARQEGVRFRPHFKTIQSGEAGEWFREYGVQSITVSSLSMAGYFADFGWKDITVAFPVNTREADALASLSEDTDLSILLLDPSVAEEVNRIVRAPVGVFIKIDTGYGRTGLPWDDPAAVVDLAVHISSLERLEFRGLLAHAGHSYHMPSAASRRELFDETAGRLNTLRDALRGAGIAECEISVGDTPTATAVEHFRGVDEIRPGNFVYFDAQQYHIGSCGESEIAAVVACPVVAVHPERGECIVYGGAVHLSAQSEQYGDGEKMYGYAVPLAELYDCGARSRAGWGAIDTGSYVRKVSQEHGVVKCSKELLESLSPGGLLGIIPVHSCLAVDLLETAVDTAGIPVPLGRF